MTDNFIGKLLGQIVKVLGTDIKERTFLFDKGFIEVFKLINVSVSYEDITNEYFMYFDLLVTKSYPSYADEITVCIKLDRDKIDNTNSMYECLYIIEEEFKKVVKPVEDTKFGELLYG